VVIKEIKRKRRWRRRRSGRRSEGGVRVRE
jgi:hypothetical protein